MYGAGDVSRSGDAAGAALREVAGPELNRRNAFRITGLSTYADRRAIRQRRQRVNTALQVGADADLDHGLPVGPDEVRAAFDRLLDDPRRRLVDELLWFWDTPDATCSCAKALHQDHDAAVRAHSAALDREIEGTMTGDDERRTLWEEAARQWRGVLRKAAFWDHVRNRIDALDDRQLDESAVDALRDALPAALLRPLAELAGQRGTTPTQSRLAGLARRWPAPRQVIDDQLEEVAAPMYESVRAALSESTGLLDEGEPKRAASNVYDKALPDLNRLSALVPPERHRRTAKLRNDTAILFNNCAMALIDSAGPAAADQARKWFGTARRMSPDSHTSEAIRGNEASLDELILVFTTIEQEASALLAIGQYDQANVYLATLEQELGDLPGRPDSRQTGPEPLPIQTGTDPHGADASGAGLPPRRLRRQAAPPRAQAALLARGTGRHGVPADPVRRLRHLDRRVVRPQEGGQRARGGVPGQARRLDPARHRPRPGDHVRRAALG
ncbi:hypothetical protein [Nonomuraea angiospora]|uniref:hypothetical protein n=1 Tax=Nonomuraea angiospora TaxID=46172 RepID=UPI0029B1AE96|nr:hypothetical protein [Nonomuraea angiospora]MDX3102074.1 hypothetical protein [Nonomuraea angiospora]